MTIFQALTLMIAFGMMIIALISLVVAILNTKK